MRSSICSLFFGILWLLAVGTGDDNATQNLTAVLGQNVTFQCPRNKARHVIGFYIQKPEPTFINGFYGTNPMKIDEQYKERTKVSREDLSMEWRNISISDEGLYECIVFYEQSEIYSSDKEQVFFNLKVVAEYDVPNVTAKCTNHVTSGKTCQLSCWSSGGYPQTNVKWVGLIESLISDVYNHSSQDKTIKTWTVNQTISYRCNQQQIDVRCSVEKLLSNIITVCESETEDQKFPLVVISAIAVLLLVIFILILYWCIRRSYRRRRNPEDPALGVPLDDCHSQHHES